jgi:hypothetical protein
MAISLTFATEVEADSVVAPSWANQTVLQGCGSSQSNSNSGAASRAGFQKVVSNELKNATSVQVTWGVQARDLGLGMNVNDWNPYIEVRSLQATSSSVVASINLNIDNFINLDGTPIQITTTNADSSNFISPVNYGTSSTGRTNYVFAYILTGDGLNTFKNSLIEGQNMAFFLINDSDTDDGVAYTLGSANVLANGGHPALTLNAPSPSTNALPNLITTAGIAFDIQVVSEPLIVPLQLSSNILSQQFIASLSTANDSKTYKIQRSINLIDWIPCATFTGNGQTFQYVEPVSDRAFFKAYRIDP